RDGAPVALRKILDREPQVHLREVRGDGLAERPAQSLRARPDLDLARQRRAGFRRPHPRGDGGLQLQVGARLCAAGLPGAKSPQSWLLSVFAILPAFGMST